MGMHGGRCIECCENASTTIASCRLISCGVCSSRLVSAWIRGARIPRNIDADCRAYGVPSGNAVRRGVVRLEETRDRRVPCAPRSSSAVACRLSPVTKVSSVWRIRGARMQGLRLDVVRGALVPKLAVTSAIASIRAGGRCGSKSGSAERGCRDPSPVAEVSSVWRAAQRGWVWGLVRRSPIAGDRGVERLEDPRSRGWVGASRVAGPSRPSPRSSRWVFAHAVRRRRSLCRAPQRRSSPPVIAPGTARPCAQSRSAPPVIVPSAQRPARSAVWRRPSLCPSGFRALPWSPLSRGAGDGRVAEARPQNLRRWACAG